MTISRKSRRKITVDDREFVWYVAPDWDDLGRVTLTVVSSDRRFFVRYCLVQSDECRHVVVLGPQFRDGTYGGVWRRFRSPSFGTTETIASGDVRALIEWATLREPPPEEVDADGHAVVRTAAV